MSVEAADMLYKVLEISEIDPMLCLVICRAYQHASIVTLTLFLAHVSAIFRKNLVVFR